MNIHRLTCGMALLGTVLACLGQTTTTRPVAKFTIGKDTTVVDGPVKADGTIDYIAAINSKIGGAVRNDENAAIILLKLQPVRGVDDRVTIVLKALNVLPEKDGLRLTEFEPFYAKARGGAGKLTAEESTEMWKRTEALRMHPWKPEEIPEAINWLQENEKAIAELERAAALPHFFVPFVDPKAAQGNALDASPVISNLFPARDVLESRAMLRASSGDMPGAFSDLKCIRTLARLAEQEHVELMHLMDLAMELSALQSYSGMANSGTWTHEQLQTISKEIVSLPPFARHDEKRTRVEEMIALDTLMMCIRGDGDRLMRLMGLEFNDSLPVNMGDFDKIDWNAAMNEVVNIYDESATAKEKTFEAEMKEVQTEKKKRQYDGVPPEFPELLNGELKSGLPAVETFLKMRANETREEYSRRIAGWIGAGSPDSWKRSAFLEERVHLAREMALVSVSLAEFRLAKGAYPESLKDVGQPVLIDTLSGKEILYRRDKGGFLLWSVGLNGKDESAAGDDLVFKSEK